MFVLVVWVTREFAVNVRGRGGFRDGDDRLGQGGGAPVRGEAGDGESWGGVPQHGGGMVPVQLSLKRWL